MLLATALLIVGLLFGRLQCRPPGFLPRLFFAEPLASRR